LTYSIRWSRCGECTTRLELVDILNINSQSFRDQIQHYTVESDACRLRTHSFGRTADATQYIDGRLIRTGSAEVESRTNGQEKDQQRGLAVFGRAFLWSHGIEITSVIYGTSSCCILLARGQHKRNLHIYCGIIYCGYSCTKILDVMSSFFRLFSKVFSLGAPL